jgi:bis(5'-nucleosyl)-tetraphosphatase (symmetrical)
LNAILEAKDRPIMLAWLREQRMAMLETVNDEQILMVHAGVLPEWSAAKTMKLAGEVEAVLRSPDLGDFLQEMYGNGPLRWSDSLRGADRLRVIVNTLTRLRFCTADGEMEFDAKDGADSAPPGYLPWFDVPKRKTAKITVAFGHWSTLGWLGRQDVLALDSGCVWGGALSALRLDGTGPLRQHQLVQVQCEQAQVPGR